MGISSTACRIADHREDAFRAVFGVGRSTGTGAEREHPLQQAEIDGAFIATFLHDETVLYYLSGSARMLFASKDGTLAYTSDVAAWQHDPATQLRALARALCPAQLVFPEDYGAELRAVSATSGETVRFGVDGDYVRIINIDDEEVVYWSSDEFAEDLDLVCGALVGALANGA